MTFDTVNHLFDRVKRFHLEAAEFYRALARRVRDSRLQLLFGYLGDEEERAGAGIEAFQQRADRSLLRTGYQFAPHERFDDEVLREPVDEGLGLDQACALIARVDEVAIELYRQLAEGTILPTDVNEFFAVLAERQVNLRNQHIRNAMLTGDI
jgi:hypothetical protein